MRLGLEARQRMRVLVRQADPARPVLLDGFRIADVPLQGSVILELQPGKADGYQIHMRPVANDSYAIDYRRGADVLSTQTATRGELNDAGRP